MSVARSHSAYSGVGMKDFPQIGLEVLVLHKQTLGGPIGLVPVHQRNVGGFQPLGQNLQLTLLLEAARIGAQCLRGRRRDGILCLPGQ